MGNKKWALYGEWRVCVQLSQDKSEGVFVMCLAHEWLEIFYFIFLQNHFVISGLCCYFQKPRVLLFKWFGGTRAVQLWVSREETTDHSSNRDFFNRSLLQLASDFLNQENKKSNQMTRLILMRKRPRISIGKSETRPEAMLARYTSESFQGNRLIKREEIVTTLRLRNIIQAAIAIAIARERIIKWQEGMCWDKLQTVG